MDSKVASLVDTRQLLARVWGDQYRRAWSILTVVAVIIIVGTMVLSRGWLGRMSAVIVPALWTLAVMRILAWRATLPLRVLALALCVGALLALFAGPAMERLANPYIGNSGIYDWFSFASRLVAFLSPVVVLLLAGRLYRSVSIADAFLLAFAVGLGAELAVLLLLASDGKQLSLAYFPPFVVPLGGRVAAGFAYWTGLTALALFASLRLRGAIARQVPASRSWVRWLLPVLITAIVFLWAATDAASIYSEKPGWWLATALKVSLNGRLTPIVTLVVLTFLLWAEHRWVLARAAGPASNTLRQIIDALRARNLLGAFSALRKDGLEKQRQIVEAELRETPDDAVLRSHFEAIRSDQGGVDVQGGQSVRVRGWGDPSFLHAASWVSFALFAVLLTKPPLAAFWSLPILHARIGTIELTLFGALLAAILIDRFIRSAAKPDGAGDPAATVQFHAEKALLGLAVAVVVFAALYAPAPETKQFVHNPVRPLTGEMPQPSRVILLLIAVALTGVTLARSSRWRSAPARDRRQAVLRNSFALITAAILVWLPLAIYPQAVRALHLNFGPRLKPMFLGLYGAGKDVLAGYATSNTLAIVAAIFVGLVATFVALALHRGSRRVEQFLLDAPLKRAQAET